MYRVQKKENVTEHVNRTKETGTTEQKKRAQAVLVSFCLRFFNSIYTQISMFLTANKTEEKTCMNADAS